VAQRSAFTPNPTIPWRALGERFSSPLLVLAAVALLVLGRVNAPLLEQARTRTGDAVAPLLALVQQPLAHMRDSLAVTQGLFDLAAENERLRQENITLQEWRSTALKLEAQNDVLRGMLKLGPTPTPILRTEAVIGEPGGVYVHSVLIGGGAQHGLSRGQPAMAGAGLIGRITELGNWSARVLLITDLNSRIPVILESTRTHAILAGDNSANPYLLYLPKAAVANIGDRLVTAGHDGVFPAGLPVGRVASIENGEIRIEPAADLGRLEYVQIVDAAAQSALTPEEAPADGRYTFGPP
jgi:rod shape-determining protein MreC